MIAAALAVCVHLMSSPAHLDLFPRRAAIAIAPVPWTGWNCREPCLPLPLLRSASALPAAARC